MEEIVKSLRALLISKKGPMDLRTLRFEYKDCHGYDINFSQFGYRSLEELIENISSLQLIRRNGMCYVEAQHLPESSHIVNMVAKQKTAKKGSKGAFSRAPVARAPRTGWKPASIDRRWKPPSNPSSRPAALSHKQIVRSPQKPRPAPKPSTFAVKDPSTSTHAASSSFYSGQSSVANGTTIDDRIVERLTKIKEEEERILERLTKIHQEQVKKEALQYLPMNGYGLPKQAVNTHTNYRNLSYKPKKNKNKDFDPNSISNKAPTRERRRIASPRSRAAISQKLSEEAVNLSSALQNNETFPNFSVSIPTPNVVEEMIVRPVTNRSRSRLSPSSDPSCSTPKTSPNEQSDSPFVELYKLIKELGLPEPKIVETSRISKFPRTIIYYCQIKMESESYTSYPDDCSTQEDANKLAASRAVESLTALLQKEDTDLLLSTETDILERIPLIIEKHFHGVWASQVHLDYVDLYNEQLPKNWIGLLDTLPNISVTPCLDAFILRYCKAGEKDQSVTLASEISIPTNTVCLWEDTCNVFITCPMSPVEIWIRETESAEAIAYEESSAEMDIYYEHYKKVAPIINVGGFYVARHSDTWYRVRILSVNDDNTATCFFIDYGDECNIPKSEIYILQREFAKSQAQAFVCRLAGLDELSGLTACKPHLENLLFKICSAQIIETPEEDTDFPIPNIILLETIENETCNLNSNLIKAIANSSCGTLNDIELNKVHVTSADPGGDIYIQIQSEGLDKIHELINNLQNFNFEEELQFDNTKFDYTQPDVLYLTRWAEDGQYYRCSIINLSDDQQNATIYFVDYGNEDNINPKESVLIPISLISDLLDVYPPQAQRVQLNIDVTKISNFTDRILDIMPDKQTVFFKVMSHMEDGTPVGEFFKRSNEDGVVYSINEYLTRNLIQLEKEIIQEETNNNGDKNMLRKKLERLRLVEIQGPQTLPSHGKLQQPHIPSVGSEFDIRVSYAVSPWNFFIQALKSRKELTTLMAQLQERYSKKQSNLVKIEEVKPGCIYVSKYGDNFYRTSVIKVIHSGSISVFYPDYGYYKTVTLQQLFPLDNDLMELPYQAIKAKLNDLKPRFQKWTMEDCRIFADLVQEKTFYSVIKHITKDDLFKSDLVLHLSIVDTSDPALDVHIHQLLINKGIALAE